MRRIKRMGREAPAPPVLTERSYASPRGVSLLFLLSLMSLLLTAGAPARLHADGVSPPALQRLISLDVKEADIHNVFRLLSRAGGLNLVVSERVQGKVTLRLEQVPLRDALQAVLLSKGLGVERVGDVWQIDTLEQLKARAEAQRHVQALQNQQPIELLMIPLQEAVATDMKALVEPFLSPRGKVVADPRTNTLIVYDVRERLEKIKSLF